MRDCSIGQRLIDLRRELAWEGTALDKFHATSDRQQIRDRVFEVLAGGDFRVDATIIDKTKTQPHLQADPIRFYKQAWFMHFKYVAPRISSKGDELFVVASSLQVNRKKKAIFLSLKDVVEQVTPTSKYHSAFFPAATDPCLQAADYAAWAIQRKHESNGADTRSHALIEDKIRSEFQPFKWGSTVYY